jgi:hypothetical protein
MENTSTYWAKCFRSCNLDLEQTTSSIAESMNASLKSYSSKPLASKTIANSAALIVAHSNTLLGKRQRQNEYNLLKSRQFAEASSQLNHVTIKCQKDIETMINESKYYNQVRVSKTRWFVWHESTFKKKETMYDNVIPMYSNVYCVETNDSFEECWCSEFCKVVSRKGIPCVHILTVVKNFHPKMVNPRWLKAYNSSLYEKCSHIFDDLLKWKTDNHFKVYVQDVFPEELKVYNDDNATKRKAEDIKRAIAVQRMDQQKQVLVQGDLIPDQFFKDELETDSDINQIDFAPFLTSYC